MKQSILSCSCGVAFTAAILLLQSARADVTISTFDNFTSNELYPSWSTATILSTPTNYIVTATNYGANYKYIGFPLIDGSGSTNIELDVTLSAAAPGADGQLGPIVSLVDGDGTYVSYRWYGQNLGQLVLNGNLFDSTIGSPGFTIVTQTVGTTAGLNLTDLQHMHMALDPGSYSGGYTVAWNNLRLTGGANGGGEEDILTNVCATVSSFNSFNLAGTYGNWGAAVSTVSNLQVTATGWGGGWAPIVPAISVDSEKIVRLHVTLSGPSEANAQLGPIVVLEDGDGTQIRFAWYGQPLGTLILTNVLAAGSIVQAGSVAGFDYSTVSFFQLQLDPGGFSGEYSVAWNDLSIIGCEDSGGTGICATLSSFNDLGFNGYYGNWTLGEYYPTNLQITASGYGGGWASVSPVISTTPAKTIQLDLSLTAPVTANGKLGPIVVLQDGDGTQLRYTWYGQNPGEHLLTSSLSAGAEVVAGNTPGFDFSTVSYFHVQLDPSTYTEPYTIALNDLSITGCTPPTIEIISQSYDPGLKQFTLTWTSEDGATYTVANATELGVAFADLINGIPSGGATTTVTVWLGEANSGFLRVRKE